MFTVLFGFTLFFSLLFPAVFVAQLFTGTLGAYPPVVFVTVTFLLNILVPLAFAIVMIRRANIMQRVPRPIPGAGFLWLGGCLYLLPQVLRIVAATLDGGARRIPLLEYSTGILWSGRFLLGVGMVILLLAIKPHPRYEYPG
jgi:hypothetical protein